MAEPSNGGAAPRATGDVSSPSTHNMLRICPSRIRARRKPADRPRARPPELQINVDVKAGTLAPDIYEVILTLRADTKQGADESCSSSSWSMARS